MAVSKETADKLVKGAFETFDEFETFSFDSLSDEDVEIFYRRITNYDVKDYNYIIETIFINE